MFCSCSYSRNQITHISCKQMFALSDLKYHSIPYVLGQSEFPDYFYFLNVRIRRWGFFIASCKFWSLHISSLVFGVTASKPRLGSNDFPMLQQVSDNLQEFFPIPPDRTDLRVRSINTHHFIVYPQKSNRTEIGDGHSKADYFHSRDPLWLVCCSA